MEEVAMSTSNGKNSNNNRFDWQPMTGASDGEDAVWQLLSLYVDGEATPEEAAQVEALLASDPAISRDLAFLRLSSESAQTLAEVEPPAHLRASILAATSHRPTLAHRLSAVREAMRRVLSPRYALPLGGLVAAGLLALAVLPKHNTVSAPPAALSGTGSLAMNTPRTGTHISEPTRDTRKPHKLEQKQLEPPVKNEIVHLADKTKIQIALNTNSAKNRKNRFAPTDNELKPEVVMVHSQTPKLKQDKHAVQRPMPVNPNEGTVVEARDYSKRPEMDALYQRPTPKTVDSANDPLDGPNVQTSEPIAVAHMESSRTTDATGESNAFVMTTVTPTMRIRRARLALAQLPPDSRRIITGIDVKRVRDDSSAGLGEVAVSGAHPSPALLVGRF